MTTAAGILERFKNEPFRAAHAILRSFADEPEALATAAKAWCEAVAETLPLAEAPAADEPWSVAHRLLREASRDCGVFCEWVDLAREDRTSHDGRRYVRFDDDLMRALVYCWPQRADGPELARALCEWVIVSHMRRKTKLRDGTWFQLALKLGGYPDIAYMLLDVSAGIQAHRAPDEDTPVHPILLALERHRLGHEPCTRDRQELGRIVPGLAVDSDLLWGCLREELDAGRQIALDWQGVVAVLDGPQDEIRWHRALKLLAASPEHQALVVGRIATLLDGSRNPARQFAAIAGTPRTVGPGIFWGRGWGRDGLPRKLLPISRVLVRGRAWPTEALHACFLPAIGRRRRQTNEQDPVEGAHERVCEVLAEAFLDLALNEKECMTMRSAALAAIGLLQPGGSRSIARGVGQLLSTELQEDAKRVSRQLRNGRKGRADPELAVMEAWDFFTAHADAPAGGDTGRGENQ